MGPERGREGRELGVDDGRGGPDGERASMEAADGDGDDDGEAEGEEPTGDNKLSGWLLMDRCDGPAAAVGLVAAAVVLVAALPAAAGDLIADSSGGGGSSGLYAV